MEQHDEDSHCSSPQPSQLPLFANDNNDVLLDPVIFRQAAKHLRFMPTIDLFANHDHHQCRRYFSPIADPKAAGVDAFAHPWTREWRPYANPPWPLIARVLQNVVAERITIMMVIPDWPCAPWYDLWQQLCTRSVLFTDAVFLDDRGRLRSKPRWNTRIGLIDGNRAPAAWTRNRA